MDDDAVARRYYDAIDAGEYDRLRDLLADGFSHDRPDRTIEGADAFVRFMREKRPRTDTEHVVEAVYSADDRVAVEGRLVGSDGELFRFVDTFAVADGRIQRLRTYTH